MSAGAWAYLVKPYATPDLLLVIGQAMRHVELQEERRELTQRTLTVQRAEFLEAAERPVADDDLRKGHQPRPSRQLGALLGLP